MRWVPLALSASNSLAASPQLNGLPIQSVTTRLWSWRVNRAAPHGPLPRHAFALPSRALDSALRGEHDFPGFLTPADGSALSPRATRTSRYSATIATGFATTVPQAGVGAAAQSGSHFFADQAETQKRGGADCTQPFSRSEPSEKLKIGGQLSSVAARRLAAFRFRARRKRIPSRTRSLVRG